MSTTVNLEKIKSYRNIKELSESERKELAKLFVANLDPAFEKYLYSIISLSCVDGDMEDIGYIFEQLGGNWKDGF